MSSLFEKWASGKLMRFIGSNMGSWRGKIEQYGSVFRQIVFPVFCFGCRKEGTIFCHTCLARVPVTGIFLCPKCGKETFTGVPCDRCVRTSVLQQHMAVSTYSDEIIAGLLEHFKYHFEEDIIHIFRVLIQIFFERYTYISPIDVVIPIPLHRIRFAERGYNQAELLAVVVADVLATSLDRDVCIRLRKTKQQARLLKHERLENVVGAFQVIRPEEIVGKHVLLVDDVYTTGSTMQECAHVIMKAGAKHVSGWSMAHG